MLCVEKLGTHTKNKNNFKELCYCLTFRGSAFNVCITTTAIRLYELSFRTVVLRIMYFRGIKTGEDVILPEKTPYSIYSSSTAYHPDTILIHMHHQNEMLIRHIKANQFCLYNSRKHCYPSRGRQDTVSWKVSFLLQSAV